MPSPIAAASAAGLAAASADANAPASERVTVTTDVLRLTLDTRGGTVIRSELLDYASDSDRTQPVVLMQDSPEHVYLAQTGLIGGN